MNTQTKQRIIGGVVLLAVVAIFLPLLFHSSRPSTHLSLSTNVPTAPERPQVQLQLPEITASTPVRPAKEVAQQTPSVTEHILNTAPAPSAAPPVAKAAATAEPVTKQPESPSAAPSSTQVAAVQQQENEPPVSAAPTPAQSAPKEIQATKKNSPAIPSVVKASPASVKAATVSASPKKTVALQSSLPQAWVIQVASFSDTVNAERLVKQLRTKNFDVYTRESKAGRKEVVRVFVGPVISQAKAKEMQRQLKQQFHLNGVVGKYSV